MKEFCIKPSSSSSMSGKHRMDLILVPLDVAKSILFPNPEARVLRHQLSELMIILQTATLFILTFLFRLSSLLMKVFIFKVSLNCIILCFSLASSGLVYSVDQKYQSYKQGILSIYHCSAMKQILFSFQAQKII